MSFAPSNRVFAATLTNLNTVMTTIGGLMGDNDHLLFYTADHGGGTENAPSTTGEESLCVWGNSHISGSQFADSMFKVKKGYVTITLTQCFSGGILDNVINPSTGKSLNPNVSSSDASGKWYGMAAANHYESSRANVRANL